VLLRLPIRKTDMCCVDGGGSWVDRSGSYKGNLSESSHGSWRRATRVFLGYTYHFRSFSSRLRHISAAARAFATSASGLVMEWSKIMSKRCEMVFHPCALRFGIHSQPCIFRVLSGLHTVRLERQGPAACAAPPSPMAAPITPLARGEESTVYSSVLYRYSVLVLAGGSGAVFETEVCFD